MEQAPETENNNDPEETKILPPAPISGNRNPPSFSAISKVLDSVSTIDQLNTAIGDVIVAAATRTKLDPDGNLASVPEIVDVPVERPSAVPSTQILKKGSSGTIKAKSSPYLSVCGYPREIWNGNIPVNLLEQKLLRKLFEYLNHSDLIQCRAVQRRWDHAITTDEKFLSRTVFVVNMVKSYHVLTDTVVYNDLSNHANLPFRNVRFQYIDHRFLKDPQKFRFRNSDNQKYSPSTALLQSVTSLAFRNCYLYWHTVKKFLVKTTQAEELIFSNCHISDDVPSVSSPNLTTTNDFDEFNAGNAVFALKALELHETSSLKNITSILKKFNGYSNSNLTSLRITYHPAEISAQVESSQSDSIRFCSELKSLIHACVNSLQVVYLDIHDETTLDWIGYKLSKDLETLGPRMNLKEFQLTPSLGTWTSKPELIPKLDVSLSLESIKSESDKRKSIVDLATSLARFLETQENLEKLGVPSIQYPEIYNSYFKAVLQNLPCAKNLKYLALPSTSFLTDDLLHQLPALKQVKLGGFLFHGYKTGWEIFNQPNDRCCPSPSELYFAPLIQSEFKIARCDSGMVTSSKGAMNLETRGVELLKYLEKFSVTTNAIPYNFDQVLKGLTSLTTLEITCGTEKNSVLSDSNLQTCILNLPKLKCLMIGCADALTDFGITGIPYEYCQLMFRHQKYHQDGVNSNIWSSEKVTGRPLSDLKGLKKLILVGRNSFTDIGIGYGLAFPELQSCHLPYSDYITDWGIERFGSANPSLEELSLSGVNQYSKPAFLQLRRNHIRMKKGDASRSGYLMEVESSFVDDFSLILNPYSQAFGKLYSNVAGVIFSKVRDLFRTSSPPQTTHELLQLQGS